MKKILQKSIALVVGIALSLCSAQAQTTTLTVSGAATWNGYMNVFDLMGAPMFGSGWAVPALKSTVNAMANTVTLQPNFNTYADAISSGDPGAIAYWTDGAGGGNKAMSALTFTESASLGGQTIAFTGDVTNNTLDAAYDALAFIKVLDPATGYSTVLLATTPLPASGLFTVTAAIPSTPGLIVQYGFEVDGINANPANEVALGNILVSAVVAPPPPTNVVTVDATNVWNGYMNVFDLSNNYQFGTTWGIGDLKSTINTGANSVTLQPNFNTYADAVAGGDVGAIAYWTNGAGEGNKIMEANTYVESTTLGGAPLNFIGTVNANTLSPDYNQVAFIKVLDPSAGYATILNQTVPLPISGPFSVTALIPSTPGLVVQYGFQVVGINANPASEVALGNVVLGSALPLSACTIDLTASVTNYDAVALNWQTIGCKEVVKYTVQRSADNKNFIEVASMDSDKDQASYTYLDAAAFASNVAYYRIVATLINGTQVQSAIVSAVLPSIGAVVLPTVATDKLTLVTQNSKEQTVALFSENGTLVRKIVVGAGAQTIDISTLPSGNYYITLANGTSLRFVKQ
jgi:hypothetical protein